MLQQNSENSKPVSTEQAHTLERSPESISKAQKMVTGSAMASHLLPGQRRGLKGNKIWGTS
jgi:hypothetical protein